MRKLAFVSVFGLLLFPGCPPVPTTPDAGPDAGAPVRDAVAPSSDAAPTTPCGSAFVHMQGLGCAPDSGTWLAACENAAQHAIDLHTTCRIRAVTCLDVAQCEHPTP